MIVLGYLRNTEKKFSRYVSTRVHRILSSYSASSWHYVPTDSNPADIASRKQTVESLSASCWLSGPSFLWENKTPTDGLPCHDLPETITEIKTLRTETSSEFFEGLASRVSSFMKTVRVLQVILKLARTCSDLASQRLGYSLPVRKCPSFRDALDCFISGVQKSSFPELFNSKVDSHPLRSLCPFLSGEIIRVGGRLFQSSISYEHKYPILLPSKSEFTNLVHHQGRVITLSSIREAGYFIHRAS